jgi:deazaflavin-dependent oxidoreductase (nitroreductase family)
MPGLVDTHTPKGLLRLAARLPIWLYRARLGWLFNHRLLMLTHIGRKSGLPRRVVIEVVGHDKTTGTYIVASGWGGKSDWFRNIQKTPQVTVDVSRRRFKATAVQLSSEEAERALLDYVHKHPVAFRELAGLMAGRRPNHTEEDCHLLAQTIPLVALQPDKESK